MGFILAQMHDLQCIAGDVGNVSFASFTTEKLYIIVGLEFGPELAGKQLILSRSVYGIKTGLEQHDFMNQCLQNLTYSFFTIKS